MAKSKFQNLTVDMNSLRRLSMTDRLSLLRSSDGISILPNFTPSQLNELFPFYYRRSFTDIGQALKAVSDRRNLTGGLGTNAAEVRNRSSVEAATNKLPSGPAWQKVVREKYGVNINAGETSDAASLIRRKEGYRSRPYWDVNAWRVGYGSDTITKADGSVVKVTPGMQITKEDAERDLQRRIPEFQQKGIINYVGQNSWDKLNNQTKAAITSLAYNYGSIAKLESLKKAISMGDKNMIAQAVESYARHNDGINYNRRMEEAKLIRNSSDTAVDSTEIPQLPPGLNPKLVEEYNRMTAYQQRNFHRALNKMGQNDAAVGVDVMNKVYQENPGIVQQTMQNTNTHQINPRRFSSAEDAESSQIYNNLGIKLTGGAARRGYLSSLQNMDPEILGRYRNAVKNLPEELRAKLKITSAFRDPNDPEIQRMYQQWLAGSRKTPMAHPTRSKHGRGKALDIQLGHLSKEERQLVTQQFRNNGLAAPVGQEGFNDNHTHLELDPGYKGDPAAESFKQSFDELKQEQLKKKARPTEKPAPALSIPNAPGGEVRQSSEVQPKAEPSSNSAPALVPALALGGDVKTDAKQLNAYAINKSRQRRDDMVVTDGAEPLFTMNSEEEMKFSPQTGKVSVNPSARGLKANPEELQEKLKPPVEPMETRQTQTTTNEIKDQGQQQPVIINQSPATPVTNSYDSIMDGSLQKMSPSFERAVARSRFVNTGDAVLGGHFDFGASNMA